MLLLMILHIRVREPDRQPPADPDYPRPIDDGDPFEFREPEKVPGKREDVEGSVGEVDEVSEGDELERRRCSEKHDDPIEDQTNMSDEREWGICCMTIVISIDKWVEKKWLERRKKATECNTTMNPRVEKQCLHSLRVLQILSCVSPITVRPCL